MVGGTVLFSQEQHCTETFLVAFLTVPGQGEESREPELKAGVSTASIAGWRCSGTRVELSAWSVRVECGPWLGEVPAEPAPSGLE